MGRGISARFLAIFVLVAVLIVGGSVSVLAAGSVKIEISGIPAEVQFGESLKGVVVGTITGLKAPAPLITVSLTINDDKGAVSFATTALRGRGNGTFKIPISGNLPVQVLSRSPKASVTARFEVRDSRNAIMSGMAVQASVNLAVRNVPARPFAIIRPSLKLDLHEGTMGGKRVRQMYPILSYEVTGPEDIPDGIPVGMHETITISGPKNVNLPGKTTYQPLKDGRYTALTTHGPVDVDKPGEYVVQYQIDVDGAIPVQGAQRITVTGAVDAPKISKGLIIDSATISPKVGETGEKLRIQFAYHGSGLPFEGLNVDEWVVIKGPDDVSAKASRVLEGSDKISATYEAKLVKPGSYVCRISVGGRDFPAAAKELPFKVTQSEGRASRSSVWVAKGPYVLLDRKEVQRMPTGLEVGPSSITYTVDWAGTKSTNTLNFSHPPTTVNEGDTVTLSLNCSKNTGAEIWGNWIIECYDGTVGYEVGAVGSWGDEKRSDNVTFKFKPNMPPKSTIWLTAGRFGPDSSILTMKWIYEQGSSAAPVSEVRDVTPR